MTDAVPMYFIIQRHFCPVNVQNAEYRLYICKSMEKDLISAPPGGYDGGNPSGRKACRTYAPAVRTGKENGRVETDYAA